MCEFIFKIPGAVHPCNPGHSLFLRLLLFWLEKTAPLARITSRMLEGVRKGLVQFYLNKDILFPFLLLGINYKL